MTTIKRVSREHKWCAGWVSRQGTFHPFAVPISFLKALTEEYFIQWKMGDGRSRAEARAMLKDGRAVIRKVYLTLERPKR